MALLRASRNESFYRLSYQFLPPVAKQLLGLRVRQNKLAIFVCNHNGIGRALQ
jgi:hypothetical protein